MVEASMLDQNEKESSNKFLSMEPFGAVKWLSARYNKSVLKIIVTDEAPIYIDIGGIRNGDQILKLIESKIRFIKK